MSYKSASITLTIAILVVLMYCAHGANQTSDVAKFALKSSGFTEIEEVSHEWFYMTITDCPNFTSAKFTLKALDSVGKKVKAYACIRPFSKRVSVTVREI